MKFVKLSEATCNQIRCSDCPLIHHKCQKFMAINKKIIDVTEEMFKKGKLSSRTYNFIIKNKEREISLRKVWCK